MNKKIYILISILFVFLYPIYLRAQVTVEDIIWLGPRAGNGPFPYEIAVDTILNRVYIANLDTWNVSVIDEITNEIIATIPIGENPCTYGVRLNYLT